MHDHANAEPPPARHRSDADRTQNAATSIVVSWDREHKVLTAFVWRRRRWRIERIERTWIVETGWWNDDLRVDRYYNRVVSEGRLFDLCFDRTQKRWFIDKIVS